MGGLSSLCCDRFLARDKPPHHHSCNRIAHTTPPHRSRLVASFDPHQLPSAPQTARGCNRIDGLWRTITGVAAQAQDHEGDDRIVLVCAGSPRSAASIMLAHMSGCATAHARSTKTTSTVSGGYRGPRAERSHIRNDPTHLRTFTLKFAPNNPADDKPVLGFLTPYNSN